MHIQPAIPPRARRGVYGPTDYTAFDAPAGTRAVYAVDHTGKVVAWNNFPEHEDPAPYIDLLRGFLALTDDEAVAA